MIVQIFSIYDIKSKTFGQPFFSQTEGTARRSFQDLANDPQSQVNKYPDDFTLFLIGSFDDDDAELLAIDGVGKKSLCNALEVLIEKPNHLQKTLNSLNLVQKQSQEN